jgi:hypothetical protein
MVSSRRWLSSTWEHHRLVAVRNRTLRSTFASNALAAGVGIHALARIMGTSIAMIEWHYGTLLDGAMEEIAGRLDALDRERNKPEDTQAKPS